MINPNRLYNTNVVTELIDVKYPTLSIEQLVFKGHDAYVCYTDQVIVKNKYSKVLKNKRLEIGKKYKLRVKYSILLGTFVVKEVKEV